MGLLRPFFIGVISCLVFECPALIRALFPFVHWNSPFLILAFIPFLFLFLLNKNKRLLNYKGLSDLLIHIHSPTSPRTSESWIWRGFCSLLFGLIGGPVGPEGAAIEFSYGFATAQRSSSTRWFEQIRRTDGACVLGAGISAAFGAPFAAILVPIELGIGGSTFSLVVSSMTSFVGMRILDRILALERFNFGSELLGFDFTKPQYWFCLLGIAIAGGILSSFIIFFMRYFQDGFLEAFKSNVWLRFLVGALSLFLVAWINQSAHFPPRLLLENIFLSQSSNLENSLCFVSLLLSLALFLSCFGSLGIFWPLFVLGGLMGMSLGPIFVVQSSGFSIVSLFAGGVAVWSSVLGIPLAAALLTFELSQRTQVFIPCLLVGLLAKQIRVWLLTSPLVKKDLEISGISLVHGRSVSVLDSVKVEDAMVTDFETVLEKESIGSLYSKLLSTKYPFLPVVDLHGKYLGLLTVDMIEESWQSQFSKLLEAKDLLYRSGFKAKSVKESDKLSVTTSLFKEIPCAPVLNESGKVVGLLFSYQVRFSYEREELRRSLLQMNQETQ